MEVYKVHVSAADLNRRVTTAGAFLAQFGIFPGGRSKVCDLPHPVRIVSVGQDERTATPDYVRTAPEFFRALDCIAEEKAVITALSWRGARLGPQGLLSLNMALRTYARRKRGLNVVRHWMAEIQAVRVPSRSTFAALFSYLEIRPIFLQKPADASRPAEKPSVPQPLTAKHYVYCSSKHKAVKRTGLKKPRRAVKKR